MCGTRNRGGGEIIYRCFWSQYDVLGWSKDSKQRPFITFFIVSWVIRGRTCAGLARGFAHKIPDDIRHRCSDKTVLRGKSLDKRKLVLEEWAQKLYRSLVSCGGGGHLYTNFQKKPSKWTLKNLAWNFMIWQSAVCCPPWRIFRTHLVGWGRSVLRLMFRSTTVKRFIFKADLINVIVSENRAKS